MKKWLTSIFLLVGGILVMTSLHACSPEEKIPDNRTKQQYEIEKEFLEMQEVLVSKDLDAVKPTFMRSDVYRVEDLEGSHNRQEDYLARVSNKTGSWSGMLTIHENGTETVYDVSFEKNKLTYGDDVPQTVKDEDWLFYNLDFPKDYFKNLKVVSTLNHREIYAKQIIYQEIAISPITKKIAKQYNLSDNVVTTITFDKGHPNPYEDNYNYSFSYTVRDDKNHKGVSYELKYTKKEAEEK